MRVSIVIPAYNEEKVLGKTLDSVVGSCRAVAEWNDCHEIIVCNNNSSDRTEEIAQSYGCRVIFEPVNRISNARNRGASIAQGEWIIFLDADTIPSGELFQKLEKVFENTKIIAGGGRFDMGSIPFGGKLFLWFFTIMSFIDKKPGGGFMFCQNSIFRSVGGFDETLYAGEELYLFHAFKVHARKHKKKLHMLWDPPIYTSSRKFDLYTPGEFLRMIWRALTRQKKMLSSKEDCHLWYDGRR